MGTHSEFPEFDQKDGETYDEWIERVYKPQKASLDSGINICLAVLGCFVLYSLFH